MRPQDIFVAIPTRGDVFRATMDRWGEIRDANPGLMRPHLEDGHLCVSDVRHRIYRAFRQTTKTALLMCDDDVVPHPDILQLAHRLDETHDLIASPILILRKESPVAFPNIMREDGGGKYLPLDADRGLQHVRGIVGFGVVAIRRAVLMDSRLRTPSFCGYDEDGVMNDSDDGMFCKLARSCGYSVWAHFDYWSDHRIQVSTNRVHQGYGSLIPGWKKAMR